MKINCDFLKLIIKKLQYKWVQHTLKFTHLSWKKLQININLITIFFFWKLIEKKWDVISLFKNNHKITINVSIISKWTIWIRITALIKIINISKLNTKIVQKVAHNLWLIKIKWKNVIHNVLKSSLNQFWFCTKIFTKLK